MRISDWSSDVCSSDLQIAWQNQRLSCQSLVTLLIFWEQQPSSAFEGDHRDPGTVLYRSRVTQGSGLEKVRNRTSGRETVTRRAGWRNPARSKIGRAHV